MVKDWLFLRATGKVLRYGPKFFAMSFTKSGEVRCRLPGNLGGLVMTSTSRERQEGVCESQSQFQILKISWSTLQEGARPPGEAADCPEATALSGQLLTAQVSPATKEHQPRPLGVHLGYQPRTLSDDFSPSGPLCNLTETPRRTARPNSKQNKAAVFSFYIPGPRVQQS